jgi:TonB family protein
VQKINRITDRFIYGVLAALFMYLVIFVYLNVNTVKRSYVFESYFDNPSLDISKEDLKDYEVTVKAENILVPDDYNSGDVKNISRDINDQREKSNENWSENKPSSGSEESIKDFEKQLFEEMGGNKPRYQSSSNSKTSDNTNSNKSNTKENASSGSDKVYSGSVMVDWSLTNRNPHQNNNWYVRNPGYTCGYGSSGKVVVKIYVNQNGDVSNAEVTSSTGANSCMLEQALKYAKKSRFNYSSSAPKSQEGTIVYTFVSQ